mmetsp:Transcript_105025/g.145261  ORF Transcript_105025/g.145261 Transcript_105025/m.145261 type:complete len:96 (+) Transcript_105025:922-1209(+)
MILTETLLKHHKGHDEEVVAIMNHEMGHWNESHMYRHIIFDGFYMILWGFALGKAINNEIILTQFGFTHKSLTVSLYLFFNLWSVFADFALRFGI